MAGIIFGLLLIGSIDSGKVDNISGSTQFIEVQHNGYCKSKKYPRLLNIGTITKIVPDGPITTVYTFKDEYDLCINYNKLREIIKKGGIDYE